jgi:predicted AlkP superfamily pyrophosphatase or phosphodiesterase
LKISNTFMHTSRTRLAPGPLLLSLLLVVAAAAQRRPAAARPDAAANARPRLVLLIVIDQFRYDYLERFGDLFISGGLRRLLRDGASWTNADYDHAPTYTAPGHAALMTGTWGAENGIVANEWYDRTAGKRITSVTDDAARTLGDASAPYSPRLLLASTLGDELRLATNDRAKVIGISVKPRSAILPVGRHASAAYWFSTQTGRMVSSSYYFNELPAWVARFNDARPADKFFGARWERLLPEAEYLRRAGPDAPPWEDMTRIPDTNTFPHTVTGGASAPGKEFYNALDYTPFTSDLLLDFAAEAIAHEQLGADDDTDFLSVSFSANDYVGHRFGPYSQEVMDVTLRVDRQIARLLAEVERRVGLRHTLVVLSADHGVAPIPAQAVAVSLPGRRVQRDEVLQAIRAAIATRYRRGGDADKQTDYVQSFINGQVYFNLPALRRDGVARTEIERVACEAVEQLPGVARCFTRAQMEAGAIGPGDAVARRVLHGFNAQRSGDALVVYAPFAIQVAPSDPPSDPPSNATHGAPYSYDTHVPVIIMGRGVRAGRYSQAATPADIAPTLATLLRVQPPSNTTGRVLTEALTDK